MDRRLKRWELALMLLREYRYKGIAKKALTILFRELQSRTGRCVFRARVDIDNYASQALMDKIGARTNGVSEFMLHGEDLENFKQDLPVLGTDMDKITTAVRKKGISCLGGKESAGYKDNQLRGKVYSDIYSQLKRNFGVTSCKNIKRNQCERALEIINNYTLPDSIYDEIRNDDEVNKKNG